MNLERVRIRSGIFVYADKLCCLKLGKHITGQRVEKVVPTRRTTGRLQDPPTFSAGALQLLSPSHKLPPAYSHRQSYSSMSLKRKAADLAAAEAKKPKQNSYDINPPLIEMRLAKN
jgi:hypothetical protein